MRVPAYRIAVSLVALVCILGGLTATAQSNDQAKLTGVRVTGSKLYTGQDVMNLTGLKLGVKMGNPEFQAAANQLSDSGAFTSVAYKYEFKNGGYVVEFALEDADLVPVSFENFVWFTDDELKAELAKRVPIFRGKVAPGGQMPTLVADALNGVLAARGLPGQVYFRLHSPTENAAPDTVQFLVSGVTMSVAEVHFTGVKALSQSDLDEAIKNVVNQNYEASFSHTVPAESVVRAYGRLGYLRAHVEAPVRKLIGENAASPEVVLTFNVTEGAPYRVTAISFAGNLQVPTVELAPTLKLSPGSRADQDLLQESLHDAYKVCTKYGFLQARLSARTKYDDKQHAVDYVIEITEGPQFHMGVLSVQGADRDLESVLRKAWTMKTGEVYNATYTSEFLKGVPGLRRGQVVKVHTQLAPGNVVHVTLEF